MLASVLESDIESVVKGADKVDYFVIGSGTAGVTSALELAKGGFNVVIIEAGPFITANHVGTSPFRSQPEIVPKIHGLVKYETAWIPEESFNCRDTNPYVSNNTAWSLVGGRTVFWGGCAPRFIDSDFDHWPFSYKEFAPYYDEAEEMIHVSGTAPTRPPFIRSDWQTLAMERLNRSGFKAMHAPVSVDTNSVANGYISHGFDSSVARLLRSGKLVQFGEKQGVSLVANTCVTKIDGENGKVTKLHLLQPANGKRYEITPRNVILACGGIQSTRLVMSSGLEKDSDVIGKYIGDHIFVQGLMRLKKPLGMPLYILIHATQKMPFQVQIQGSFEADWYSPYHSTVWLDHQSNGLNVLFYCFGIATVEKNNRVALLEDAGCKRGGASNYCVIYDRSEQDKQLIKQMMDSMPEVAKQLDAEVVRIQENPPGAALHEIGGLRMGDDPNTSITDQYGRFWRYRNLYSADSSTWRNQGAANPYLTITACALRMARKLVAEKRASLSVSS